MATCVDLFCGCGGLSLGFLYAGFEVVKAYDADLGKVETYNRNLPPVAICQDIRFLQELPAVDVIIGGPPCQSFSRMGNGDPLDPRSTLLKYWAELVRKSRPKYFVAENVPDLATKFKAILDDALTALDEYNIQIFKLNAKDYGIPQSRQRIFVVGSLQALPEPKAPLPCNYKVTVGDALKDLWGDAPSPYALSLGAGKYEIANDAIANHALKTVSAFQKLKGGDRDPSTRQFRLPVDGAARTIMAGGKSGKRRITALRPVHPVFDRVITPREAARLQSFPDWFKFDERVSHSLQEVGNAVPPFLAQAVALEIKKGM